MISDNNSAKKHSTRVTRQRMTGDTGHGFRWGDQGKVTLRSWKEPVMKGKKKVWRWLEEGMILKPDCPPDSPGTWFTGAWATSSNILI